MNIRKRLVLFIASVLLPAFLSGVIAVWFVYAEQMKAQERSLSEAARVLTQLADSELHHSERILAALAASPDLAGGRLERFHEHAKRLADADRHTLVLSDRQGRQLLNTRVPAGDTHQQLDPGLVALRNGAGEKATVVSDLMPDRLAPGYEVAVQVPVVIDGHTTYYLSRHASVAELQHFLGRQQFPPSWIASVVDRRGHIIARSANSQQFVGKGATGTMAVRIRAHEREGVNDGTTLDGTRVKAFFHRAPASDWTVVLSVPVEELNRPALQAALLLTGLVLLTFAGAIAFMQRYLRRILGPVHRLRDDATRLGRGEPIVRFTSGLEELDVVNEALVRASTDLRAAKADMERKVADAIASTEQAERALLHSQKLEALGRLTGGVAHDFNNVLQSLTSSLQLISLEPDPARIPARIAVCEKAVMRATALVAQLRAFGRTQEAYLHTVNIDEAVHAVLPMLKNSLPSAVTFETEIGQGHGAVTIDVTQFELALLNLVINARDAMAGQGLVVLRIDRVDQAKGLPTGDYVRIMVADTGAGMAPEVLAKAFDPFFTTKPVDKGSGLGLAQAYGFATQSGGTLVLESTQGVGTQALLYLPCASEAAASAPAATPGHGETVPQLSATLLFVEDDPLIRDSVTPILEQAGVTVLAAGDGEQAMQVLASRADIDVLFTDIVMPGTVNGVQLAEHVRAHYPHIAIVLATGYFEKYVDMPGAALLTKPYQARELLEILALRT